MDGLKADILQPPELEMELSKTELKLSVEASLLRGPKGDPGEKGEKGDKGDPGADGKDGRDGEVYFGVCETEADGLIKTVTVDSSFVLKQGVTVSVVFKHGVKPAAVNALNVNETGPHGVTAKSGISIGDIGLQCDAGQVLDFVFSGSAWIRKNGAKADPSTWGITKLSSAVDSDSEQYAATPLAVKTAYDKALEALEAAQSGGGGEEKAKPHTYFGRCLSPASSATKAVTVDSSFKLFAGATVLVLFSDYNTTTLPMLDVNGTGGKYITRFGATPTEPYSWAGGSVIELMYDGTYWVIVSGLTATTLFYGKTKLSNAVDSTSEVLAATSSAVKKAYDKAVEAYDSVSAKGWKVLWKNKSPTYSFAAQEVEVSGLSDCDFIMVAAKRSSAAGDYHYNFRIKDQMFYVPGDCVCSLTDAYLSGSNGQCIRERSFTVYKEANMIAFETGHWSSGGGSGDAASSIIPLYILGMKI